jgi:bleomycin hydrolase
MDKAARLDYGQSLMTHAMVLAGVDVDGDGNPTRWRVENSWGDKGGDKGYMVMTDRWFDQYLYEVVVDKAYLPADLLPCLEAEPVVLDPWDPMGSLAAAV